MTARQRSGASTDRFSQLVREIRGDVRQYTAAERSEIDQPKLSRVEHGKQWLRPEEAERFADALAATPAQRRELLELANAGKPRTYEGQPRLSRRGPEIQLHTWKLERASALIRSWQPLLVPGILQIPAYEIPAARVPATAKRGDVSRFQRRRAERRALLDDPDRRAHLLMSEAVLHWTIGSHAVMAEQLDHLLAVMEQPNVVIGIVTFGPPAPPAPPTFHLYDERTAEVDTLAGATFLDTRGDIERMTAVHAELDAAAIHDDAARAAIAAARDKHREDPA